MDKGNVDFMVVKKRHGFGKKSYVNILKILPDPFCFL